MACRAPQGSRCGSYDSMTGLSPTPLWRLHSSREAASSASLLALHSVAKLYYMASIWDLLDVYQFILYPVTALSPQYKYVASPAKFAPSRNHVPGVESDRTEDET